MGFRTAPTHFASKKTKMYVISSRDNGTRSWDFEMEISMGADMREPNFFIGANNTLHFTYFEAGTNPIAFQPHHLYRVSRQGLGKWTQRTEWGQETEITWQYTEVERQGVAREIFVSSYAGDHYKPGAKVAVFFNVSHDGENFRSILKSGGPVYSGGISEVGYAFAGNGDLYAVGRNEDGDESGSGRRIWHVPHSTGYQDWS